MESILDSIWKELQSPKMMILKIPLILNKLIIYKYVDPFLFLNQPVLLQP